MSGFPGDLAIILALAMAGVSGLAFLLTALGKRHLVSLGRKAYYLQVIFIAFALAYLWQLFFSHDFSIKYVYEYSSSDLPFFYLLSALWAGQDGTYLLWLFFSLLLGLILIRGVRQYTTVSLVIHTLVNLFLYIMLITLSPFRPLGFPASEGAGLNPLLQDMWMVIHPPIVFVGFALAGIVFSLVLAAMVKRNFDGWVKITFPYLTATALALAIANVLGGYWAYKTLGWGGYWAWDPVENTSFIPWLIALGAVHGLLIERRSGSLRRINLLLSASIFLLAIYGTFLTRSGVLADFSVHSFVDLGVNAVLIGFVVLYFLFTILWAVYGFNRKAVGKPMNYNIYSRDFMLFVGMCLMVALGLIVLFWSSLPFLTTYLTDNPSAAEISTYNMFAFPLAILISLFLTLSPLIRQSNLEVTGQKFIVPTAIIVGLIVAGVLYLIDVVEMTIAVTLFIYLFSVILYLRPGLNPGRLLVALASGIAAVIIAILLSVKDVGYLFFIGSAAAAISAQIIFLAQHLPDNLKAAGGSISHLGYGLMLLGILSSSAFGSNEQIVLPRGETNTLNNYGYRYHGLSGSIMQKNNEILLTMIRGDRETEARPHYFYTRRMDAIMKRPHIEKNLLYDLYLSPQEIQELPHAHGLVLGKGETRVVGDYTIKFVRFDIASHSLDAGPAMSVGAVLEITKDNIVETSIPRMEKGNAGLTPSGIDLYSDGEYRVVLEKIDADNGLISLSIPGLIEAGPPDRLIMDISIKPGINLLWVGTLMVFLGLGLSTYRRLKK